MKTGQLYIWDGIDCELHTCESHAAYEKFCAEYIDKEEGIHPDIESVILLKVISEPKVEEINKPDETKFNPDVVFKVTYPLELSQLNEGRANKEEAFEEWLDKRYPDHTKTVKPISTKEAFMAGAGSV